MVQVLSTNFREFFD